MKTLYLFKSYLTLASHPLGPQNIPMSQLLRVIVIASALTGYVNGLSTFQWPNPLLSYADNQLYEGPLGSLVTNCAPRDDTTVSAQWLRLVSGKSTLTNYLLRIESQAYHDVSTHDEELGTGGLDASIMYELERPQVSLSITLLHLCLMLDLQNIGTGMAGRWTVLVLYRHVSNH